MTNQQRFFTRPRLWALLCGLTLAVAQFFTGMGMGTAQAATTTCTPNGLTQDCTVTFDFTGAAETWTVPAGVTSATFDLYGARGGIGGGLGGRVTATLNVTPGATYQILVGGLGDAFHNGFNGGALGQSARNGGGASDVRSGAFGLADRMLVAGGGGGGNGTAGLGGAGGHPTGGNGADGLFAGGGGGGTQTAGGAGGTGDPGNGNPGTLGQGGSGYGGGGGGYYGGGGGGFQQSSGATGGGGSSFGPSGATFQNGVRAGDGLVTISYSQADTSAPVANPTQSPAAAPSGWNNTDVTVTWNWSDPSTGSGYVSGIDAANCTTSSVAIGSATVTVNATCRDLAGNIGTATYSVRIDPTAPTANPSQSPVANAAGWNNTDVTVNWNWVFTGAIIDTANCTTSLTSSGEGVLTLSATCKDVALNQRTVPYTVKVDKTAPVVTVDNVTDGATYTLGSVPISGCSTSDALSGVATPAAFARSGGNPDGTGSFTITCSGAVDNAGNSAAPVSVSYSVTPADNTAPVITPNVVGTLGTNGWYVSDVTVSWSVVDAESAISSQSGCDPVTVNADTPGVTLTCSATSSGGSSSQSVTIKRDATAPTLSAAASSAPNANGWYNSNVTVQFTCADNLSGIATCPADQSLSSEGSAVTSTAQMVTDGAGNSSAASNAVTVQLDKTAPIVTVTGVSNGANYTLGSVPTAACSSSDALSGVATQATVALTGGNPNGTGSFTATCSGATDVAGNSGSASASYSVNPAPPPAQSLRQQVETVRSGLAALLPGSDSKTAKSLQKVLGKLDLALAANLWQPDGSHLTLSGDDLFNRLQDAVKELAKIKNPVPTIGSASSILTTISRSLAQTALDEAIAGHGDAKRISQAQSKLSKGDSEAAKGKLDKAIAQYEDTWEYAQQALGIPVASSLLAEEQPATPPDLDEAGATPDDEGAGTFVNQLFLPLVTR